MMFLLFRTFRKTLHVATNTEETILDILYERVNKILLLLLYEKILAKYLVYIYVMHSRLVNGLQCQPLTHYLVKARWNSRLTGFI